MQLWKQLERCAVVAAISAPLSFGGVASAQDKPVTDILVAMRAELKSDCSGKLEFFPGTIEMTDLNDDRRDDAIIDYDYVMCDGAPIGFCGTGGCRMDLWIDIGKQRYVRSVNMLSQGLKIRKQNGRTVLAISVHGSECGKSGAAACTVTGQFRGRKFDVLSRR